VFRDQEFSSDMAVEATGLPASAADKRIQSVATLRAVQFPEVVINISAWSSSELRHSDLSLHVLMDRTMVPPDTLSDLPNTSRSTISTLQQSTRRGRRSSEWCKLCWDERAFAKVGPVVSMLGE